MVGAPGGKLDRYGYIRWGEKGSPNLRPAGLRALHRAEQPSNARDAMDAKDAQTPEGETGPWRPLFFKLEGWFSGKRQENISVGQPKAFVARGSCRVRWLERMTFSCSHSRWSRELNHQPRAQRAQLQPIRLAVAAPAGRGYV